MISLKGGKGSKKLLKLIGNDGAVIEVNELLWAIGRAPEIETLNPANVGVKLTSNGHIEVDSYQNTSVDGIYALGDVNGQAELIPGKLLYPLSVLCFSSLQVAIAAGRALSNRLFGTNHPARGPHLANAKLDYANIPTVVFAHPEVRSSRGWHNRPH